MGKILLRRRDTSALLDALDRLYQPVEPTDFAAHLFGVLSGLLPGTLNSFDFVDVATGVVESHIMPEAALCAPLAEVEAIVREFLWQNPVVPYMAEGHYTEVIQPTDLISRQEFYRTDFYQLAHRPLGIRYQVAGGLAWPGRVGGFIVNKTGLYDFTDREVELVRLLRPHVERAFTNTHLVAGLRQQAGRQPALAADSRLTERAWVQAGGLTPRETEVLRWVAVGKRDGEIACILGISLRTVNTHVTRILAKLQVETRTGAALAAHEFFTL